MHARRPTRPAVLAVALAAFPALFAGCGTPKNCQNACDKLFQTDQCNLEHPGVSLDEQRTNCLDACTAALSNPGDIGDYDPNQRTSGSTSVKLNNDQEAAAWMECVDATSCEYLGDGYCAPVSF